MKKDTVSKIVLLMLVVFISALFFAMIRSFLMAVFLAGIFAALAHPLYSRITKGFGGRRAPASGVTILVILLVILLPLVGLFGIVTNQAIKVGGSVKPWIEKQMTEPDALVARLQGLPYAENVMAHREVILKKAGEAVGRISSFFINHLSAFTFGTVNFVFMLFVLLYAMFFLLMDGDKLLYRILYYLPLEDQDERRILEKFTSVSRATLKGTAVIGILQGGLSGIAFAVVGIPSALFWGTIMTVLSIIPGIGTALIWIPAAIILAASGAVYKAAGLALFCAIVVGSLDNILRPALVGRDTQMHELMIFFSTMGGIFMFGVPGIIIGPIIAALFITIWDIYGLAFRDVLPDVRSLKPESVEKVPGEDGASSDEDGS
ncbi:MAG: AI-2E family transporter [Deltaproteobacteria bacterium]|nr:AI-2E family transporter [Deltaproteobacteria bacterium]